MADRTTTRSQSPDLSKNEAVRQAVKALGKTANRSEIRDYVLEEFGIEMTPGHVSTARADAIRKLTQEEEEANRRPTPSRAAAKTEASPPPAPKARPVSASNGKDIQLDDIVALRKLVDRVGADELRTLINVMA